MFAAVMAKLNESLLGTGWICSRKVQASWRDCAAVVIEPEFPEKEEGGPSCTGAQVRIPRWLCPHINHTERILPCISSTLPKQRSGYLAGFPALESPWKKEKRGSKTTRPAQRALHAAPSAEWTVPYLITGLLALLQSAATNGGGG